MGNIASLKRDIKELRTTNKNLLADNKYLHGVLLEYEKPLNFWARLKYLFFG